jgi:23S rRNA-/tRNA-specific pseudouridylate synthase
MALLSYSLQFDHPTKNERMEFKVGMPDSEPWVGFL